MPKKQTGWEQGDFMQDRIRIAIIDSGVRLDHPAFASKPPVVIDTAGSTDSGFYGHGTAIYNIIRKTEDIADIINFRLVSNEQGVEDSELLELLHKIDREYQVDIINLSLGVNVAEDRESLFSVCQSLAAKGAILISAFDNAGAISYPAAFEHVIGVTSGQNCPRIDDFEYIDDTIINIGAKGGVQRLAWDKPDYLMIGGNSFACAHVTVQAARFMSQGIREFGAILEAFKKKALKTYSMSMVNVPDKALKISRAALFPFFKEMHSLIRFADLLDFEIIGVYDSKYSALVGSTTDHIMKDTVASHTIQNIDQIQWDTFDTLILGHLDEMSHLINKGLLREKLILDALAHNKQVFSFDDISKTFTQDAVYCPVVSSKDLPPSRFGKLYRLDKPVVGVYGTSSRQGKFTLQLLLRKKLRDIGYTIGQIGTEPSALLYGMDYAYPMGYNSSVYIHGFDSIRYLNHIMNQLCEKQRDIIITGSQSGTIPYDTGNMIQYTLYQYEFLMGTQPDAVVLCVNPFDEPEYISRTIKFIESSVDCTVVALVVFPMDIKDGWSGIYGQKTPLTNEKYHALKAELHKHFTVPVYKLGNASDMESLVNTLTGFFEDNEDEGLVQAHQNEGR
jgi:uncharacterized NAD-dependent epimerase/dehydratase family protein